MPAPVQWFVQRQWREAFVVIIARRGTLRNVFYAECTYAHCLLHLPLLRPTASVKLWKTFIDVFNFMPIAALVASRIFCMHGGIPHVKNFSFDRLRSLQRPITANVSNEDATPDERMITDLMWADPSWAHQKGHVRGYGLNEQRGTSHVFGPDALSDFMDANELDLIARAHECVKDGFKFFSGSRHKKGCITIFSAPNYGYVVFLRLPSACIYGEDCFSG